MHIALVVFQRCICNRAYSTRLFLSQMRMRWWKRRRDGTNDWASRLGDRLVGVDLLQRWAQLCVHLRVVIWYRWRGWMAVNHRVVVRDL